jgi:hypothetical protein
MADWTQSLPEDPAPGPVDPPPTRDDPNWRPWIRSKADECKKISGRQEDPVSFTFIVTDYGPIFWFAAKGENPGPWEKEDVTAETEPGGDFEYRDYTRYTRLYPSVELHEYESIKVLVVFLFADGATWEKEFTVWQATGRTQTLANYRVWRWRWTSWEEDRGGGLFIRVSDQTKPPDSVEAPDHLQDQDSDSYRDVPPRRLTDRIPRRTSGQPREFFIVADGWGPASQATRILAGGQGWVKFAALGKAAAGRGEVRKAPAKRARRRAT